ncbi:MAG: DUF5320 domain-containing protein [Candidatus Lokiarchaeia archaeon]
MGFRGRRRNLAWWSNKPMVGTRANITRNTTGFRTASRTQMTPIPAGYRYVGYCRCGYGPNAYYQTPNGNMVPAYQMFGGGLPQIQKNYPSVPVSSADRENILKERLEHLQEEIADVTNQLEELEGKKKSFPFKWRRK